MKNGYPQNCDKCPNTNRCNSAYGNLGCVYREAIMIEGKNKDKKKK